MTAGRWGRLVRAVLGLLLVGMVVPFWLDGSVRLRLGALALVVALVLAYSALAAGLARRSSSERPLLVACCALAPWIAIYALGIPGGPLFGRGEGQLAALTYLGLSFLVVAARADCSCEVFALPGLVTRRPPNVPCLFLYPLDALERRLRTR